jgi:hypothetical protein
LTRPLREEPPRCENHVVDDLPPRLVAHRGEDLGVLRSSRKVEAMEEAERYEDASARRRLPCDGVAAPRRVLTVRDEVNRIDDRLVAPERASLHEETRTCDGPRRRLRDEQPDDPDLLVPESSFAKGARELIVLVAVRLGD